MCSHIVNTLTSDSLGMYLDGICQEDGTQWYGGILVSKKKGGIVKEKGGILSCGGGNLF